MSSTIELLNSAEAAVRAGVSEATIYRAQRRGSLPAWKRHHFETRYLASDVDAFKAMRTTRKMAGRTA